MLRNQLVRNKSVAASEKHLAGIVLHEWCSLYMKVSQHFIRAPAANKADDIRVNACKEEGICPCCAKAASRDVVWQKAQRWANICNCVSNSFSDEGGSNSLSL